MVKHVVDDFRRVFEQLFTTALLITIRYMLCVVFEVIKFCFALFLVFVIAYSLFFFVIPLSRFRADDKIKLKNKYEDEDRYEDEDDDSDMDVDDGEMWDIEKGYAKMLRREAQEEYLKMMTRGALERQFAESWKKIGKQEDKPVSTDAPRQKPTLARHDEPTQEEIGDKLAIPDVTTLEKGRRLGSLVDWWKKKTRHTSPRRRIHKEEIGDMGAKETKNLKTEKGQQPQERYLPFSIPIERREDGLTESEELLSENDLTPSKMRRSRFSPTRKDAYKKYRWSNMEEEWARMVKKKQEEQDKNYVDKLKDSQQKHGPQRPEKEAEAVASERVRPNTAQGGQDNHKERRSELSSSESPIAQSAHRRKGENDKDIGQMKEELVKTPRIKALEKAFEILLETEARKREQHGEQNIDDVARVWKRLMKRDALEKAFTTILEREQKNETKAYTTLRARSTSDEYISDMSRSAFTRKCSKQTVDARLERYPNDVHLQGTPKVRRLGSDMRSHSVPPYETPRRPQAKGSHLPRRKLLNEFGSEISALQDKSTAYVLSSDEIAKSIPKASKKETFLPHRRSSSKRPREDRFPLQRIKRIGEFESDEIDQSISIFAPAAERQREDTSNFQNESAAYRIDPYEINKSAYSVEKRQIIIPSSKRPRESRPPLKRSRRVEEFEIDESTSTSNSRREDTSPLQRQSTLHDETAESRKWTTRQRPREDREPIRGRKLLDEFDSHNMEKSNSSSTESTPRCRSIWCGRCLAQKKTIIPRSERPREVRPEEEFEANEIDESMSTSAPASSSTPKRPKYEDTPNIPHEDKKRIQRRKLLDEFDLEESDQSNPKTRNN
uniref:Uncharacterized protein n=1 Tax=Glossina morsitans morsitans TaxID=37546 RepID=A0A340U1C7_GLOMM